MLGRGRIRPMARSVAKEFYEQAAAARAVHVAGDPVASIAASGWKIGAAHGLGLRRKAARQFGCVTHDLTTFVECVKAFRALGVTG